MKSKCRERNANELAGMLSTGQIGRFFSEGVTIGDWGVASGITKGLASHAGTSRRSPKVFHLYSMLGKSLQVAGKVGQISRLNRTGIQIVLGVLKLLKDRCIGIPVADENVVEDGCQLVDLTWNR